jgi:regulator of replication initiation timing
MNSCPECAALRLENDRLKKRIQALELAAKAPKPASRVVHIHHGSPHMQQADIARRTLPPANPRGPQC